MTLPSDPDQEEAPIAPEPEGSVGEESRPPPRKRSVYWRPPASTTGAGRFVTVSLAVTIGVLGVLIATSISILLDGEGWGSDGLSDPAPFVLGWLAGVGLAVVGIGTLTGIAWMVWQHRAHANRVEITEDALRPGTVWWWLVPIASVFMPFLAIRDLAKGSHDRPGLRKWWWATYLTFGITSGLATILPFYLAAGAWQEWVSIVSYLFGIIAAVLAIQVVRLIDAGLEDGRREEGWPTGWQPVSGRSQLLFVVGGAAAASAGALLLGMLFPRLLEEVAMAESGLTATNDFTVGTCFDHLAPEYPKVPCEGPHGAEVYAKLTYPGQAAYPGEAGFESWAVPLCYSRFERYTGIRYEESSLDFDYLYPGAQGWGDGDHEVICYLFDPGGDDLTEPIDTGSGTA